MVLVVFGDRRKFTGKVTPWVAIIVWLTYLSADFMATVALSTLIESDGDVCTALVALWAPFLLLHLGGPDSITAYSLEDNDLWLRHFLTLCIQVGGALYIYWKYRTNHVIAYLAILIFVAGIIKYGERIYILRLGSTKRLRSSMFSAPEPNVNQVELMFTRHPVDLDTYLYRQGISPEARYLHEAYILFKMFMPIFSDLTLRSCKHDFRSMAQLNLIYFSLQPNATAVNKIEQFLDTEVVVRKYLYTKWQRVDIELKSVIYSHLLKKREEYEKNNYNYDDLENILAKRGDGVLEEKEIIRDLEWSTNKVEFSHSLLLWHLATDLCSHVDAEKHGTDSLGVHYKISKNISEYMLYVQVIRPFLLPRGISEVRFRDTCQEVKRFLQKKTEFNPAKALDALFYRHDEHHLAVTVKSKSGETSNLPGNGIHLITWLITWLKIYV
ncbi:hypothetical protein ACFE04_003428 [Oxalis oulophora]